MDEVSWKKVVGNNQFWPSAVAKQHDFVGLCRFSRLVGSGISAEKRYSPSLLYISFRMFLVIHGDGFDPNSLEWSMVI